MNKNKRLIANIVEIIVGIILSVLGFLGILDSYWSGMGTALIIVGGIMIVRQIRYRVNTEYKENVDTEVSDERNKFLRIKAWSWAGYLFVLVGAFGSIVLKIIGLDQYVSFASGSVCLIMVLYWISYLILKKKY